MKVVNKVFVFLIKENLLNASRKETIIVIIGLNLIWYKSKMALYFIVCRHFIWHCIECIRYV